MPDPLQIERRLERLQDRARAARRRQPARRGGAVGTGRPARQSIVAEREDVIEAIRKLRTAIQELNREGRDRLLGAFDVVNAHFQRLFTHLFGGGTAELQLVELEDPLDAGLEILARPPGKKPQTMTLLSGGEQALTAMALIFAVFLTNPAPICVLDEVDAPLDDHNVERYCNLMDEMSRSTETRFVIITHNPDHHGADEPPLRRHHGGAGRLATRLGRPGNGRQACARRAEGAVAAVRELAQSRPSLRKSWTWTMPTGRLPAAASSTTKSAVTFCRLRNFSASSAGIEAPMTFGVVVIT